LRAADIGGLVEGLAMEVRELHRVRVDEQECPDAGAGERHRRRRAEPADADDQRPAAGEARVAFVVRGHGCKKAPLRQNGEGLTQPLARATLGQCVKRAQRGALTGPPISGYADTVAGSFWRFASSRIRSMRATSCGSGSLPSSCTLASSSRRCACWPSGPAGW